LRDPLYDYIFVTDFESPILDSEIFQRLDRIRQLPTAHLVYPSAKYTRKTHSLGVMHLAHEAILHLLFLQSSRIRSRISPLFWGQKVVTDGQGERNLDDLHNLREDWWNEQKIDEIVQSIRLAGMLHDLGHGPLTHIFEDLCKPLEIAVEYKGRKEIFDHELMSRKIIEEKEGELGIKRPFTFQNINQILDRKEGEAPLFVRELINSGYDCDKMDYLLRDAYATGTQEFGRIDYKRIICGLRVVDEALRVSVSAIDALMNSFDALQYMYTSVYYHRAARIFDFMIEDALSKVPEFLQNIVSDVDTFLSFDDHNFVTEVTNYVKENQTDENRCVIDILNDYLDRKKKYMEVFSHRLTSGYLLIERTNNALEELKRELNETVGNLEIRIDFRPQIRPVGINIHDVPKWLLGERFYDPSDGEIKPLHDLSRAYHQKLRQYTILFRIFANRDQLDPAKDTRNVFRSEKNTLRRVAEEKLGEIEDLYESLS